MNRIAPQLQIENTSTGGKTWAEAKAICENKGNGWRLPTQREMYLVLSMGGTSVSLENQGFGSLTTWTGSGFEKINAVHWTLTQREGNYWLVGANNNLFDAWPQDGGVDWAWFRCVRSVP